MWPWEHLAVGYVLLSAVVHAGRHRPPGDASALVLAVATQLPDLVDKPLSWGLGLFPTGHALAHSLFVAVPAGVLAVAVAVRTSRTEWGVAFLVGYWSHLLGDAVDPLRAGDGVAFERLLWPLVTPDPYDSDVGLGRGFVYLEEFLVDLATADLTGVGALFLLFPAVAVLVWVADGTPGPAAARRLLSS